MATTTQSSATGAFVNEPPANYRLEENARGMREAIAKVREELGREYDLVIGGKRIKTADKIRSLNPAKPSEVVGIHQKAGAEHVEPAMQAALAAFETWKYSPVEQRTGILFRTAEILRRRKYEFNAWLVLEVGKNYDEAEADTCEAIDFLELYARQALVLDKAEPVVQLAGERDYLRYIALGVGAVISPWNFPNAIALGMTAASVVCGNTVILKPSSDSPTIAAKFFEALEEAGLPPGVVNFCPGAGATFGNGIVAHPKTRYIAFTGSRDVGLDINTRAAQTQKGQVWIKRTVLEMGGKDSIVVDADANIDAAVAGVAASAFGYQGQKCSACSRAIVHQDVYDEFVAKLKDAVEKIAIGSPEENAPMGPVINEGAMKSILDYIEIGKKEGRLITGGGRASGEGYFIQPTVIADIDPQGRLSQEEIFGPVLAVIKARDYDDALAIANNTEYGLTGSVYATSPEKIERAKREFHVGNLYINRKCTGAVVGANPFGGFNMSGTDSKAGGTDYLYLFSQAKSIGHKL
ncbi:MAG TPA: L-glutamate gamma-semialdehyde dehydrogenase [Candidatus Acidoferrales bacterium]|nr:L-glutamate gamma-semialdehyde dehydrogenase [Candidatus Acidoferrales bacterium]